MAAVCKTLSGGEGKEPEVPFRGVTFQLPGSWKTWGRVRSVKKKKKKKKKQRKTFFLV